MQTGNGDDPTGSRQVVTSVIQDQFQDSNRSDKDGKQVSQHEFSASLPSEQSGSACSELTHLLITKPDSVDEPGGYVLVDPPAVGNQSTRLVGPSSDPHHPHSTINATLATEQGKEARPSGTHSLVRKNQNQCPPGALFPDHYCNEVTLDPTPIAQQREEVLYDCVPNIVVFGETGVGKSSIINLIADQKLADTSNDAVGCTFQHERYPIALGDVSCALWDTTGLDEGTEGTVPAEIAEENLIELMRALARSGGIHLIIYCIRGTRVTKALRRNYDLFYVTVCRKRVPVALVVTGLEHQLGEMETWWDKNEAVLRGRYGMQFDTHACVTTLNVNDLTIQQRRFDSQTLLRALVVKYSGRPGWAIGSSFMSWLLPAVHTIFREVYPLAYPGNTSNMRKVAICDSFSDNCRRSPEQIGDLHYEFIRVAKRALHKPKILECHGSIDASLLVFYASPLVNRHISPHDVDMLDQFRHITGGQRRPIIIMLRGCDDKELAQSRWREFAVDNGIEVHPVPFPRTLHDAPAMRNDMIEKLYPKHIVVKNPGFFNLNNLRIPNFCFGDPGPVDDLAQPVPNTITGQRETSQSTFTSQRRPIDSDQFFGSL